MKIGIMADTHDHVAHVRKLVAIFQERGAEILLHAGDICSPFVLEALKGFGGPVRMVFGNNDGDKPLLLKRAGGLLDLTERPRRFELAGKRFLLLHEGDFLDSFARSGGFDVIIYGHSHTPETSLAEGVRIINPGEACGWLRGKATAALYDARHDRVEWIEL